jgi:hypothetical protein
MRVRSSHLGLALRVAGLILGILTAAALILGVDPVQLAPFLVKIANNTLAFISAIALLAAGAIVGRRARIGR